MRVVFESAAKAILGLPSLSTFSIDPGSVPAEETTAFVERVSAYPREFLYGLVEHFNSDHVMEFSFWGMVIAAGMRDHQEFARDLLQEAPLANRLAMRNAVLNAICRDLPEETAVSTIQAIFKSVEYISAACKTEAGIDKFLDSVIQNLSKMSPEGRQQVLDCETKVADPATKMSVMYGLGATVGERLRRMGVVELYPAVEWVQALQDSHKLTFPRQCDVKHGANAA